MYEIFIAIRIEVNNPQFVMKIIFARDVCSHATLCLYLDVRQEAYTYIYAYFLR